MRERVFICGSNICGKMVGSNGGPRKYVHRRGIMYTMRRLGSLPGFAIPGCMILDRSSINLGLTWIWGQLTKIT